MKVTVQQAAANAAVAYLKTQLPDVAISSRWPGKDFPGKAITLITAGSRRDEAMSPRVLSNVRLGDNQTRTTWQVAECTQPFQLDVWATSFLDRDDIVARLDSALRAGLNPIPWVTSADPVANGFFVALEDGWEESQTTAKFSFLNPDYEDSPDSVARSQFRATYRGTAWMKLTVPATVARQKHIHLVSYLNGEPTPFPTTTLP